MFYAVGMCPLHILRTGSPNKTLTRGEPAGAFEFTCKRVNRGQDVKVSVSGMDGMLPHVSVPSNSVNSLFTE